MKFLTKKDNLLKGLKNVINIVSQRTTMPILSNILMEAENSRLTISATDLDISISTSIDVEVKDKGSITVHSKSFFEIIRELPNKPVEINVKDNVVTITSDNGVYSIVGLSKEEFPSIPTDAEGEKLAIDFALLKDMVDKTSFAVSKNDTRKELNGVFWKIVGNESTMVATDGHKLAKVVRKLPASIGKKKDIIVPPKALDHLGRLISEGEEGTDVVISDNYVTFHFENTALYSRLIEGPYPNYEQVIPYGNDKELTVEKDLLQSSIRRVSIFSDFQTHQIRFTIKKDKLLLSAVNRDISGEAKEELAASMTGKEMESGYNGSYLVDILKRFDSEEVVFKLSEPLVAGLVFPKVQKKDEEYVCLIMPLKLD